MGIVPKPSAVYDKNHYRRPDQEGQQHNEMQLGFRGFFPDRTANVHVRACGASSARRRRRPATAERLAGGALLDNIVGAECVSLLTVAADAEQLGTYGFALLKMAQVFR